MQMHRSGDILLGKGTISEQKSFSKISQPFQASRDILGLDERRMFENPLNAPLLRVQTQELEQRRKQPKDFTRR